MEQLPRLQTRIASLEELHDLIRALRALAASRVKEAQSALEGVRSYVEVVEDAIAAGANLLDPRDLRADDRVRDDPGVLIAVCSEHGFVGGFNDQVLELAQAAQSPGQELMIVGQRGAARALEQGLEARWHMPMATHVDGVASVARRISRVLAACGPTEVVFGRYSSGGGFDVRRRQLLPLDPAILARRSNRNPPMHHLDARALLDRLTGEYLLGEVTRVLMESLASESGARLRVMTSADDNIKDNLAEMTRQARYLRQEITTTELLDVVTGSEVVFEAD